MPVSVSANMETVWEKRPVLSPSLICLDMCNLQSQAETLERAGTDVLHADIIDGHFSPSLPLGLETVRQLKSRTGMQLDSHVMATENDYFVDELLDIGAAQIVFHIETEPHADHQLKKIKERGVRAGVALKPATPLRELEYILEYCDSVLLMLINPGYAWSAYERQVPYAERKIKSLADMIRERGLNTGIIVDGRVSLQNVADFTALGASQFVLGSTCLKHDDLRGGMEKLRAAAGLA
ncbi:MAG: ribulose-phosphate 3-epimerase [Synergistaceae bacterium]|nr:ribulose-phosphate 3-epimerase [Synergistaceae bacterium]